MKLWQNYKKFWMIFLIGGCVTYIPPSNYVYKEITTPEFTLASWQKLEQQGGVITFYLEGDGYAFNYEGRASRDPTPRNATMRKIAFRDKDTNVVYLARPCQFLMSKNCEKKYWTTGRFAPEVINAEVSAIRQIMQQNKSSTAVLVGYSGGAMVAGLIAVQNPDIKVKKLITIAGLLEHRQWTKYQEVPPLVDSLDLSDYRSQLQQIPQIHFVGGKDKIIVPSYAPVAKEKQIMIKSATHTEGWDKLDLSSYK